MFKSKYLLINEWIVLSLPHTHLTFDSTTSTEIFFFLLPLLLMAAGKTHLSK